MWKYSEEINHHPPYLPPRLTPSGYCRVSSNNSSRVYGVASSECGRVCFLWTLLFSSSVFCFSFEEDQDQVCSVSFVDGVAMRCLELYYSGGGGGCCCCVFPESGKETSKQKSTAAWRCWANTHTFSILKVTFVFYCSFYFLPCRITNHSERVEIPGPNPVAVAGQNFKDATRQILIFQQS